MAGGAGGGGRARAQEREAAKVRKQKIFIAVAGVALLGLVGFQLPSLLGSSPSSGPSSTGSPAGVAVPLSHGATGGAEASASPVPHSIARLAPKDLFLPQVSALAGEASPSAAGVSLSGPAVRLTHFVSKDVFDPQITPPAASQSTPSSIATATGTGSGGAPAPSSGGSGYIVVIGSIPGIGSASQKAAARGVVAADNAGLKDVAANDAVPGESGSGAHFTVFTGPYPTEAIARSELVRALRDGYPRAHAQLLPNTSGKGF